MARVWLVRADGGQLAEEFRAGKHISIGWNLRDDLSGVTDRAQIETAYRRANRTQKSKSVIGMIVGQIRAFLEEMQPGDHVLTPRRDHSWLMHGIVGDTPAYFVAKPSDPHHHGNRRAVRWEPDDVYRYSCTPDDQATLRHRATIRLISDDHMAFFEKTARGVGSQRSQHSTSVLSAEEKAILDTIVDGFHWAEFQDLVASLLSAMGCEILHVAPPGPDEGVDIRAVSSGLLTPDVPLSVQVKRYKVGHNISAKTVRDLRSGIPFGGRGVFVTTANFAKAAPNVASQPRFPQIALINGSLFVNLLIMHWQEMDIPQEFRDRLEGLLHDAGGQSSS